MHPFIKHILESEKVHKTAGGSMSNTLRIFSSIIRKHIEDYDLKMLSGFCRDDVGKFLLSELDKYGIGHYYEFKDHLDSARCGVALVRKERSMMTYIGEVMKVSTEFFEENKSQISEFDYLFVEGYFVASDYSIMEKMLDIGKSDPNKKVASSLSAVFAVKFFTEKILKMFEASDYIFCNRIEALAFAEAMKLDN